jgi:hydrogenase maturation protein HypF
MRLEDAMADENSQAYYSFEIISNEVDFRKLFVELVADIKNKVDLSLMAIKFHNSIVEVGVEICKRLSLQFKINKVVLSGGSFQNYYLSSKIENRLQEIGIQVYVHKFVPANDGGISLGQLGIAASRINLKKK